MPYTVIIVDDPAEGVRRVTLNRPEKRNALFHTLRGELLQALREADQDDSVRVSIVRGAGPSFSAGYDLGGGNEGLELPFFTAHGDGQWPRHVTEGWIEHLGSGQAGDRPGAWLLPGRRQRAGHRLRPGLRRRGRPDRLPGRPLRRARHALPPVDDGHAQGHGGDAHGRLDVGRRSGAAWVGPTRPSRSTSSTSGWWRWRPASPSCRPTWCRSTSGSCTARWK